MTDDLVKRLRDPRWVKHNPEAADRIEQQDEIIAATGKINIELMELSMEQKDRIEALEKALREIADINVPPVADIYGDTQQQWFEGLDNAISTARAALGEKK